MSDPGITQAAFDRLLFELDPDREQAGLKYEAIRHKLTNLFRWRGCVNPDEYVDMTIDRVTRKFQEGAEIHARDPYLYFHGVALNVLREHWKKVEKHNTTALDELVPSQAPSENPIVKQEMESDRLETELRLDCLNHCIADLPKAQLEILTAYHDEKGGTKMAQRNELARKLDIPMNALRIRVYRIRGDLEACVGTCVKNSKTMK